MQRPLSRGRVEAATKTFAWLGFRNSTSHVSNCVELAYQPDEKRRMSARCATNICMVNKVRSSVATSRDGRAASPREVDASLHVVMDGASAGAASSLRLEKQVRLARALPGLGRSAGIDCPPTPPPPPLAHTPDHALTHHLALFSLTATAIDPGRSWPRNGRLAALHVARRRACRRDVGAFCRACAASREHLHRCSRSGAKR